MDKLENAIVVAIITLAVFITPSCHVKSADEEAREDMNELKERTEKAQRMVDESVFVRHSKAKDLCIMVHRVGAVRRSDWARESMLYVPCEKVEHLIVPAGAWLQ